MISIRAAIIIGSLLTAATPSLADPWTLKKYPEDGFQAEWSGPVVASPTKLADESKKVIELADQYLQDSGSFAYIINAQKNRYSTLFDKGNKGSFDTFHCKAVVDKLLNIKGIKAKEIVGTDCDNDFRIRARYFADGKWYYQVIAVMGPSSDLDAGKHFVEAFKLIARQR